ncbi:conserved exported protein of unknown function [Nitrospira sp. KM1]|uniref:hypothetical protein n=1 Tax=Nitrospira sp. KM1 TaxID=1936990 RepID=UPI0013A7A582|nr:hypothetical protein [Nitrospira sp. KM1]BCA53267.1 conserved exported protein of unknown function [Nitrospira sp. KM1]
MKHTVVRVCGVFWLCVVSPLFTPSANADEPVKPRAKFELSLGTWISVGETTWAHNASSVPGLGNPTSKLTYKDVGTNVVELTGKLWASRKVFLRLNVGGAGIGGGRLTDDDYGTGQRLFSRTYSDISGDSMWYLNADVGMRLKEFTNQRGYLDFFGGYQFWHTRYQAVGVAQIFCDPSAIPGVSCAPAGTNVLPGVTAITNTTNWHSIRAGLSTEYRITRWFSVHGSVALIPASFLNNKDVHHLRSDLQQNPSFSMVGFGVGADADAGIRVTFNRYVSATAGYRLYYNRMLSGHLTVHPVSSPSDEFPLTEFQSLRHGLTAGLNFSF